MEHLRLFKTRSISLGSVSTTRPFLAPIVVAALTLAASGCGERRAADEAVQEQEARLALYAYFDALVAQDRESIRQLTTDDFVLIENGYPLDFDRFTETWDVKQPWTWKYSFENLAVEIAGDIALFQYGLNWHEGTEPKFSGIETGVARRENGRWLLARFHGTWLTRRVAIATDRLADYIGTYGDSQNGYRIVLDRTALYAERIDRQGWSVGVRRAEVIPTGPDQFALEFAETPIEFERDATGRLVALPEMGGTQLTRFLKTAP